MTDEKIEAFNKAVDYILDEVRFNEKGNTLHGSADYKAGFKDAYKEVLARVAGTKSNYASMIHLQARAASMKTKDSA